MTRIALPSTRIALPSTRTALPSTRIAMPPTCTSLPRARFALRLFCVTMLVTLTACGRKDEATQATDSAAPAAEQSADAATQPGATEETSPQGSAPQRTASGEGAAPGAHVTLAPTQGNKAAGELAFYSEGNSVRVSGQVTGLKAGTDHAIHIHEKGDCRAADASSAGDHFNPTSRQHGHPDTPEQHHSGDMYNVYADDKGNAMVENRASEATLGDGAPTDVIGKSVVVHEKGDDYKTQPAGDSGKRLACGVIQQ